jgi:hypothetical protein
MANELKTQMLSEACSAFPVPPDEVDIVKLFLQGEMETLTKVGVDAAMTCLVMGAKMEKWNIIARLAITLAAEKEGKR